MALTRYSRVGQLGGNDGICMFTNFKLLNSVRHLEFIFDPLSPLPSQAHALLGVGRCYSHYGESKQAVASLYRALSLFEVNLLL